MVCTGQKMDMGLRVGSHTFKSQWIESWENIIDKSINCLSCSSFIPHRKFVWNAVGNNKIVEKPWCCTGHFWAAAEVLYGTHFFFLFWNNVWVEITDLYHVLNVAFASYTRTVYYVLYAQIFIKNDN